MLTPIRLENDGRSKYLDYKSSSCSTCQKSNSHIDILENCSETGPWYKKICRVKNLCISDKELDTTRLFSAWYELLLCCSCCAARQTQEYLLFQSSENNWTRFSTSSKSANQKQASIETEVSGPSRGQVEISKPTSIIGENNEDLLSILENFLLDHWDTPQQTTKPLSCHQRCKVTNTDKMLSPSQSCDEPIGTLYIF